MVSVFMAYGKSDLKMCNFGRKDIYGLVTVHWPIQNDLQTLRRFNGFDDEREE